MPTMKDVAAAAQVSIATVSATLRQSAYVSQELKDRVLKAVAELGYEPNSMASGLKRGKTSLIGLIVPDITNPFFTEFVDLVQRDAMQAGYSVLLAISEQDPERQAALVRLMRSHQAEGTILCAIGSAEACRQLAPQAGKMKLVFVDNAPEGIAADGIVLNNQRAAMLATEHLLAQGHTRVATIAGPTGQSPGAERLEGFLRSMREHGLEVPGELIRVGHFLTEPGYEASRQLLAVKPRPTAVFVANNHMLIGLMRAVSEAGLAVPSDISVASIDDFPWAAAFSPAITTVRQPIAAMATAALRQLLGRIDGDESAPRTLVLQPELVVRASCAPPQGAPASRPSSSRGAAPAARRRDRSRTA